MKKIRIPRPTKKRSFSEKFGRDSRPFGSGEKHLIFLPGLGDGLRTVKGMALPMAAMYRLFAKDFTVSAGKMTCPRGIPPGTWPGIRRRRWSSWELRRQIFSVCPWAA